MAISGMIYFFVGFGMALIICIVLPTIPKVFNDAIKQIKSEQQKLKEQNKVEIKKDGTGEINANQKVFSYY